MLENLQPQTKKPSCRVRTYYETLDATDAKLLRQYIDDENSWNCNALARALRVKEVIIDAKVIRRHRDNLCSCEK